LHEDFFAFVDAVADLRRALVIEAGKIGEAAGFAGTEEPGAAQTDIDKGGLHTGKHALDAAEHDVADDGVAAAAGALFPHAAVVQTDGPFEEKLLQAAVFNDGNTSFPGPYVDKDFLWHWALRQ
jgi:hypothetical protein